jgi:hypothetical protein
MMPPSTSTIAPVVQFVLSESRKRHHAHDLFDATEPAQ